jgi:hypothetical protein
LITLIYFALLKAIMDNPFFKNNGPFKIRDILSELKLENDQNIKDQNIIDIKDL